MSKRTMMLGKKAEKLVKDLLEEAGFKVYPYGYEHTLPKLANQRRKVTGKAGAYLRHMPDFVVVSKKNEAFFVEVKYRKAGKIELEHIFNYPNCYVILLTPEHILAQSTRFLYRRGWEFTYLPKMPPFKDIPVPLIMKYVDKVRRVFGKETWFSQKSVKVIEAVTKRVVQKPKSKYVRVVRNRTLGRRKSRKRR